MGEYILRKHKPNKELWLVAKALQDGIEPVMTSNIQKPSKIVKGSSSVQYSYKANSFSQMGGTSTHDSYYWTWSDETRLFSIKIGDLEFSYTDEGKVHKRDLFGLGDAVNCKGDDLAPNPGALRRLVNMSIIPTSEVMWRHARQWKTQHYYRPRDFNGIDYREVLDLFEISKQTSTNKEVTEYEIRGIESVLDKFPHIKGSTSISKSETDIEVIDVHSKEVLTMFRYTFGGEDLIVSADKIKGIFQNGMYGSDSKFQGYTQSDFLKVDEDTFLDIGNLRDLFKAEENIWDFRNREKQRLLEIYPQGKIIFYYGGDRGGTRLLSLERSLAFAFRDKPHDTSYYF